MVASHQRHLMMEPEGNLRSLGGCGIFSQRIHKLAQGFQLRIAGIVDHPMQGHLLQAPADLQNGPDLLFAQHAAVVVHNGHQRFHIAVPAVIRYKRALSGAHL